MNEKVIFYQPLSILNQEWLKSSLLFIDQITAIKPLLLTDNVYDRAISRFKLLSSSEQAGVFSRKLMTAKDPKSKFIFHTLIGQLSETLGLREVETDHAEQRTPLVRELTDRKVIETYTLSKQNQEVRLLLTELKTNIHSIPDIEPVNSDEISKVNLLLSSSLRESLDDLIQLFPGEVPEEMYVPLDYNPDGPCQKFWEAKDWLKLKRPFLDYFFNSISVKLSEVWDVPILTDCETNFDVANRIRFKPGKSESNVAKGALYQIIIDNIQIDNQTHLDKIFKFKERYEPELKRFRHGIADLGKTITLQERSAIIIQKQIEEVYEERIKKSMEEMERALKGMRIKYSKTLLTKIALISGSAPFLAEKAFNLFNVSLNKGLVPFFVTSGFMAVQSIIEYQEAKKEKLSNSPITYLLKVNEKF